MTSWHWSNLEDWSNIPFITWYIACPIYMQPHFQAAVVQPSSFGTNKLKEMTKEFFNSQLTRDKKPFSDLNWMEEMQQCTKKFCKMEVIFWEVSAKCSYSETTPINRQHVLKNVYKEVRLLRTMKYKLLYEYCKNIAWSQRLLTTSAFSLSE